MTDNDSPGDKHPGTTDDSTETKTPLADELREFADEVARTERQAGTDNIDVLFTKTARSGGKKSITLSYSEEYDDADGPDGYPTKQIGAGGAD
jgi:hypothetical protein